MLGGLCAARAGCLPTTMYPADAVAGAGQHLLGVENLT